MFLIFVEFMLKILILLTILAKFWFTNKIDSKDKLLLTNESVIKVFV